jgi:hypothetical protein
LQYAGGRDGFLHAESIGSLRTHGRHRKLCASRLVPKQQCITRRRRRMRVGRCAAISQCRVAAVLAGVRTQRIRGRRIPGEIHFVQA